MKINTSISQVIGAWLLLVAMVMGSLSGPNVFDSTEAEDAIESVKSETENGSRDFEFHFIGVTPNQASFSFDNKYYEQAFVLPFSGADTRAPQNQKLYILYRQLKSFLG